MDYLSIKGSNDHLLILFHGTGGNEYSLLQIAGEINPYASIYSFVGNVGTGKARRFYEPLVQGKVDRERFELHITEFLELWKTIRRELASRSEANSIQSNVKVTFIGYSNGANFILGLLEKEPHIADQVILLHPSDLGYSFNGGGQCNIIITVGASDYISVPGNVMKLAEQLKLKFPNTVAELLDGGHEITDREVQRISEHYNHYYQSRH